ncbi:MAG TPA: DUF5689 domain-containing protein [Bacteroidales bacterium]|nr:DUF5689 domain-containing protein [Bacteroidales bacterium]
MKRFNHFLSALLLMSISFVACDQRDFEMPPLFEPVYSDSATMTIADFKTQYAAATATEITDSMIISGIVVANDISGNMYKEMTIMDSTGGLKIAINQGDLYTEFRLGQRIFIECKGLWVGKYGGYMQLGGSYNGGIGQMTWETAQAHVFKDGWPNPTHALLTPEVVSMDLVASEANMGKLITLENVYFSPVEGEVCATAATDGSAQTLSKILTSSTNAGRTIVVRLSSASDFANKLLPTGNGNLTGILSLFGTTYQFTPRDSMDFEFAGFGKGYVNHGLGTKADPYTTDWALTHQGKLAGWVTGYIVGAVKSGINAENPINGNEDISWIAPFMNNTVVISSDSLTNDWTKCVVVNLPVGSSLRDSINLSNKPRNIRHKLAVTGTFENYLGGAGVTVANGTSSEYWLDHLPVVVEGDGTQAKPYTVAQAKAKQNELGKWVTGYIVGFITSPSPYVYTYSATGAITTNLLIADSPSETVDVNCVPVQLPAGTIRDALNLSAHPTNLGKKVSVKGDLMGYFSVPGVKNLTAHVLEGEGPVVDPTTIFSEAFSGTLGNFTSVSVVGDQLWAGSSYGATMSGFANSVSNTNEDWLISPAINLTGKTSAVLSFMHTINKGLVANMVANHTLWVSTNYTTGAPSTATWTQVTIPTYPTGSDWTFVNSGNIALPSSVLGNSNCRFAFKYLCSTTESSTWEIKTLKIVP